MVSKKRIQLLLEESQCKVLIEALKQYTSNNDLADSEEYIAYEMQLETMKKLRTETF